MAGWKGRQPQAAKLERSTIGHLQDAMPRTHPVAVKTRRAGGGQRQFVPRDVIAVRVGDEAPRLAASDVDGQLSTRQKQSGVVVEQGINAALGTRY